MEPGNFDFFLFFLKLIIIWHKIVWLIVPWGLRNFIFIFEILKKNHDYMDNYFMKIGGFEIFLKP